jgi:hypothetical protein
MGLRFQKRISIPGARINLSKGGVSLSVGTRGAWVNVGQRGVKTTIGLPGSGLSWTEQAKWSEAKSSMQPAAKGIGWTPFQFTLVIVIGLWVLIALFH